MNKKWRLTARNPLVRMWLHVGYQLYITCHGSSNQYRGRIQRKTWCMWLLLKLTIPSPYVHSRVDSNTFTKGNPMPESTLTLMPASTLSRSQVLWIWPRRSCFLPVGIGPEPVRAEMGNQFPGHWAPVLAARSLEKPVFGDAILFGGEKPP